MKSIINSSNQKKGVGKLPPPHPKNTYKKREKEKMKKIYGVSSKFDFGAWHHIVYQFDSAETAEKVVAYGNI